ncbi:pre-mRNA-processing factor 17 [Brevipalpus obovatus]|uniref:pre-mRNA-processing factor 17 n=1 Tax=Brevipalpus obovatus TaxID=246614 RepID=UPI003D9DD768
MIELATCYASSDEDEDKSTGENDPTNPKEEFTQGGKSVPDNDVVTAEQAAVDVKKMMNDINICPFIDETQIESQRKKFLPTSINQVNFNVKYDLCSPLHGPASNPLRQDKLPRKNFLTGVVEATNVNDYHFEAQRIKFHCDGIAFNPSDDATLADKVVRGEASIQIGSNPGDPTADPQEKKIRDLFKNKKRLKNGDPSDVSNYLGPWAPYENESAVARPSEEEQKEIDELLAKRKKSHHKKEDKPEFEEKSTLHISDPYDYQGRSFLFPPKDIGVSLNPGAGPSRCFLPKNIIHTYTGHTKAITAIQWFPKSAHLFLSASMDCKIKLWETYKERRCVLTYMGHKQAVRSVDFNRSGERFVSCSYDRALKLWDTETGQCIKRFNNRKVAFCVKFNPDEQKSHLFLSGMSDKKILCWDTRTGNVVQEYDRHLGAINTITFIDNNRRFVSTSDDKSIRVWEWDIPVDMKYIADPGLHSMPAVCQAPNAKWLACQSMDNKIQGFSCLNNFKLNSKKIFTGHMSAGYACQPDFSPDMSYLISGDADGKLFVWDWKTTKLLKKLQAHENVCISCLWHPHETSKILTAGWDAKIHLWD